MLGKIRVTSLELKMHKKTRALLSIAVAALSMESAIAHEVKNFNKENWTANKDRGNCAAVLVKSKALVGLSKKDVHAMLGIPTGIGHKEEFYPLGDLVVRGGRDLWLPCLEIRYDHDKVIGTEKKSTHNFGIPTPEGTAIPDNQ
jgi:hypothetical protein